MIRKNLFHICDMLNLKYMSLVRFIKHKYITSLIMFSIIIYTAYFLVVNQKQINQHHKLNIFDLSGPLAPAAIYSQIECNQSATILISTLLCIHSKEYDSIGVSGTIRNHGFWEGHVLIPFMNYLYENPDWLFIDAGANIGQYTLFAARLGTNVVAIEPYHPNIQRIHKAAFTEKTFKKIILIKNALSNKRNEIRQLHRDHINIGAQGLLMNKATFTKLDKNNDYQVETILFDDIVPYLPKKYKKAILKIDIEGFEIYAFQNAQLLFDSLDIRIVFMEWAHLSKQLNEMSKIIYLIDFFYTRNYEPFDFTMKTILKKDSWQTWTADIVWKKKI
jgi:FkbM family methyltransferase